MYAHIVRACASPHTDHWCLHNAGLDLPVWRYVYQGKKPEDKDFPATAWDSSEVTSGASFSSLPPCNIQSIFELLIKTYFLFSFPDSAPLKNNMCLVFPSFAYQISSQNEWPNLLQTEKLNENNTSAKFFANREVKWKMPVAVGSPSTLNYYLSWPVLTFVLSLWLINKTSHKFWSCIRSCVADNVNKS